MNLDNPIESAASAIYSAIHKDINDIQYSKLTDWSKREYQTAYRKPRVDELELYHFPQTWPSTSLGFGGIGGQAITSAYTSVIIYQRVRAAVYFNGKFAYKVDKMNDQFMTDLQNKEMKSLSKKGVYLEV